MLQFATPGLIGVHQAYSLTNALVFCIHDTDYGIWIWILVYSCANVALD